MVTKDSRKPVIRCSTLVLMLAVMCLALTSYCKAGEYALLLQQSPVEGGSVEPGTGIHQLSSNSQIILRAVPGPGYQFVTWLGDVDEPGSPVTTSYMDSPKIVIAVFERIQYESIEAADLLSGSSGGGLRRSATDISSSAGGGAIRQKKIDWPSWDLPDEESDDFPVPDDGLEDDFPVPEVPEPATIVLLGLGSMILFRRKRKPHL